MPITITKRWITIRVEQDGYNARLSAMASDDKRSTITAPDGVVTEHDPRSATASVDVELPTSLLEQLRTVIDKRSGPADGQAMSDLYQSLNADREPSGPPSIRIEGSISMAGDPGKE